MFWPDLLESGFLQEFISPIVMADGQEFFSEYDYKLYCDEAERENRHPRNVQYYKGLGTFTSK